MITRPDAVVYRTHTTSGHGGSALKKPMKQLPQLTQLGQLATAGCNNTYIENRRKETAHLTTDTIVLIHGLWMTPLAWEHWVKRYEERGFKVITPGYPGVEQGLAGVEALRRDPSPLADLGVHEVFDHLADVI
jgi:hypothetical protein